MVFVKKNFTNTLEVKQSKFIAYLTPFSKFEETLCSLKKSHPKARHFVVGYRYLNEYDQVVEYSSDDGEPKGTSGKPSLMVLQGRELINTAVIIVRYFGGTKLGTGGLVRAYSDAVNLVLEDAQIFEYKKEQVSKIEIKYSDVRLIEYECEAYDLSIEDKVFDSKVIYTLKGSKKDVTDFLLKVERTVNLVQ